MSGQKTTTATNVYRMSATDTKRFAKFCGADIAPQVDKLAYVACQPYTGEHNVYLLPVFVSVLKAPTSFTSAERREYELLERLIAAGVASDDDKKRATLLQAKADAVYTSIDLDIEEAAKTAFSNGEATVFFSQMVMA